VGVPARLAVGFDTGSHNLLTGYYDVHESDAHAWVEVGYSRIGWQEYDPTHAVPPAAAGVGSSFLAGELLSKLGHLLARLVPGPVKAAAAAVGRSVAAAAGWAVRAWPVIVAVAVVAGALLLSRRRRRRAARAPTGTTAAFASLCRTFERRGHPRPPGRTPREHAEALVAEDPVAREASREVGVVVAAFERDRYAASPTSADEVAAAMAAARRVRELAGAAR
jgi:hypothetical protein